MPKNKKVLMLVENLSVPADPRVWREAQTLHENGYQVVVICPRGETRDQEAHAYIDGIHIYRYRLNTTIQKSTDYIKEYATAMLNTLGLSLKVWLRHGFDVIHAANPPDTFFAIGLFYRPFGKKFVFDQHDLAPEMFSIKFENRMKPLHKLLQFCERCSYRTANVVITTNESQKRNVLQNGCAAEKIFVVRNGPDDTRFHTVSPEPELKQGHQYLLAYIGVMGVQDGVDYVLYALNELINKRDRHDIGLVLMGDGDQFSILQNLTQDLKLGEYVHFTGWIGKKDLLRYLSVTDIGLSPDPSNRLNDRSTMLKTLEYMAMGRAIVAFDLPETRYSAQEAAIYATPNRVEDFADKIELLLEDEALRNRMGALGRKRIEDELSWNQTKKHLLLAYQTLFSPPGLSNKQIPAPSGEQIEAGTLQTDKESVAVTRD